MSSALCSRGKSEENFSMWAMIPISLKTSNKSSAFGEVGRAKFTFSQTGRNGFTHLRNVHFMETFGTRNNNSGIGNGG
jgi:hypothetical protein